MMELCMYTIWDAKAEAYQQPFFAVNNNVAIRMLQSAVNDPGTELNKHPEDFSLFVLGKFDLLEGKLTLSNLAVIAKAHEIKETL